MAELVVTQVGMEVLFGAEASAAGSAHLQHTVSGTVVVNVIGHSPLTASSDWIDATGNTFSWAGSNIDVSGEIISNATYTVSYAMSGALNRIAFTAVTSDATTSIATTFLVHPKNVQTPSPFDGSYQGESQLTIRVYP